MLLCALQKIVSLILTITRKQNFVKSHLNFFMQTTVIEFIIQALLKRLLTAVYLDSIRKCSPAKLGDHLNLQKF